MIYPQKKKTAEFPRHMSWLSAHKKMSDTFYGFIITYGYYYVNKNKSKIYVNKKQDSYG
jgi:hypothetical protein